MTYEELLQEVVPHLLARCQVCRETHEEILSLQELLGHWNEEVVVTESREAPELWARIASLSYEEQLKRLKADPSLQTWGLCQLLLRKSREAGFEDPTAAVNFANLAVQISAHLGDVYHPEWVKDLRARALAQLGNARRVLGELRSADDVFRCSEAFLAEGTGDPRLRAEILDLESSLRRAQRKLKQALHLLKEALAIYRAEEDQHGVGKVLLKLAKVHQEMGDLDASIKLLKKHSSEIKATADPDLIAYSQFNLLTCLVDAKRYEEAEQLLPEVEQLFSAREQPLNFVRLGWAKANIAFGLNRIPEAEAGFLDVQQAFLERGMAYDAALVSLDLALVYLRESKLSDLKKLAGDLVVLFESRDVHREALGALYLFQKACEEERITEMAVSQLAEALRRGQPAREG
jgi:tetratricopeptide (TPR) repeat protein